MAQPLVFVNNDPNFRGAKANRRIVATHIGKYHRNRSKPLQQRGKIANISTAHARTLSLETSNDNTHTKCLVEVSTLSHSHVSAPPWKMIQSLDAHRLDPFRTTGVSITPQMEPIFMYYFNTIMPVVEPVLGERNEYQQWLFPFAMTEPALFYAILACMAHDIEQASEPGLGLPTRRSLYVERSQYKLRATRALNECLANPAKAAESSTMMAVHFFLWEEIFAGGELVHLEGVRKLLNFRGGFTGIQRKAIEAITVGSFWRAIRTKTKPELSIIVDQTPMSLEQLEKFVGDSDATASLLGQAFLQSGAGHSFDEPMCQIFREARLIWICFEQIGIHHFTTAEKRSISIQRLNLDHRLLSYPFDHDCSHRTVQEACRLAFVLYSNAHYNVIQPSSEIARCLVQDLQAALKATDLFSFWGNASTILVWILFLGAHMSFGQLERPWFVAMLGRAARKSDLRRWTDIRECLLSYYYSPRVFEISFRAIWAEVEVLATLVNAWVDG